MTRVVVGAADQTVQTEIRNLLGEIDGVEIVSYQESSPELSATVAAPRPLHVAVAGERGSPFSARACLAEAARALRSDAAKYGDYPWSTYSLAVMRDL